GITDDHCPSRASGGGDGGGGGGGAVPGGPATTVRYGRWLATGSSLLLKERYRSRNFDGSELISRPKFVEGLVTHPCTMDVTSHCLNPGVLSMAFVSTGALMSDCARGMLLAQQVFGVQELTPSY